MFSINCTEFLDINYRRRLNRTKVHKLKYGAVPEISSSFSLIDVNEAAGSFRKAKSHQPSQRQQLVGFGRRSEVLADQSADLDSSLPRCKCSNSTFESILLFLEELMGSVTNI